LIHQTIDIFNGITWSPAEVLPTGSTPYMLRIAFSDGSHLDCTPGQKLRVKWSRQGKRLKEVRADALKVGHIVPPFRVSSDIEGSCEPEAYTYAAFLGDGGIEVRKDTGRNRYKLSLYRGKHHLPVTGTRAKEGVSGEIGVTVSHLDPAKLTRMKQPGLPDWVFALDRASISQFVAGLIDTDGCFYRSTGGIAFDTSDYETALDVQLLLRRFGCAYVTVHQTSKPGDVTNFASTFRSRRPRCYRGTGLPQIGRSCSIAWSSSLGSYRFRNLPDLSRPTW
jgi:intein/homing endonuclease